MPAEAATAKKDLLEMIRTDEAKKLFYGQGEVSTRTLLDLTMTQGGIYGRQANTRLDFSIILSKIRHEFQASTFSDLSHLAKVSRLTANELVRLQRSRGIVYQFSPVVERDANRFADGSQLGGRSYQTGVSSIVN
jgi:hypothetical protein